MTVCIAAITGGTIIGATDRMVTAGDILFQPNAPKTLALTSSIVVMISGDATLAAQVIKRVSEEITSHIEQKPDVWLTVREVATRYVFHWAAVRRERAEQAILWPLGLTAETFLSRQSELAESFVTDIAAKLQSFWVPHTACIFAGVDLTGPNLYDATDGNLTDLGIIGFATSGSGGRHAASQFMLAQYSRQSLLPEALLLVYSAKKRAEIAPGVGGETDLWMIGPQLGSFTFITHDELREALQKQFLQITQSERDALSKAKQAVETYMQGLSESVVPANQESIDAVATA